MCRPAVDAGGCAARYSRSRVRAPASSATHARPPRSVWADRRTHAHTCMAPRRVLVVVIAAAARRRSRSVRRRRPAHAEEDDAGAWPGVTASHTVPSARRPAPHGSRMPHTPRLDSPACCHWSSSSSLPSLPSTPPAASPSPSLAARLCSWAPPGLRGGAPAASAGPQPLPPSSSSQPAESFPSGWCVGARAPSYDTVSASQPGRLALAALTDHIDLEPSPPSVRPSVPRPLPRMRPAWPTISQASRHV